MFHEICELGSAIYFFNRPILIPLNDLIFFFQLPAFASVPSSAARALREMLHVLNADADGRHADLKATEARCNVLAAQALALKNPSSPS